MNTPATGGGSDSMVCVPAEFDTGTFNDESLEGNQRGARHRGGWDPPTSPQ